VTNYTNRSGEGGRGGRPRRPALSTWSVERTPGGVGSFSSPWGEGPTRAITFRTVTEPLLVLGSTQPESDVRRDAGIPVVRRRSGGGAVLLTPGDVVWADVVIARDDPLWSDDVGRAFHWLGEAWARAIDGDVHRGGLVRTAWSSAVCFAGLGPGEVTVDGRKVVGISQRRTRDGALFQCAALRHWRPLELLAVLTLPPDAVDDVVGAATGLGDDVDLEARLLAELPR
jgi:lipoate---protein ligase